MKASKKKTKRQGDKETRRSRPSKPVVKKQPAAAPARPTGPDEPLGNAKHEAVVMKVVAGQSAQDAYLAVYGGKVAAASTHGPRLVRIGQVKARIAHLQKAIEAKVLEEVPITKIQGVRRLYDTLDIPITEVMRAMAKAEKAGSEKGLTERERTALLLCSEKGETMFGPRYKMVGLMDRLKQIGGWLGWENKEVELGAKTLAAVGLMTRTRMRLGENP